MSSQNIRKMVTTAILIALTIVFQFMRPILGGSNIISTYIIGSLVNLALIVAACAVGTWSGASVALVTPLIALLQGHTTLPMLPWIIAGNLVISTLFALFAYKNKTTLRVAWVRFSIVAVIAALLKFAVITLGQSLVLTSSKGFAFSVALGTASGMQSAQIVTALLGALLGSIILPMLPVGVVGKNSVSKS